MLLTIDAGNTRTKWAIFNEAGEMINHGACQNDALATTDFLPPSFAYERVVVSNVAGEQHAALLAKKLTSDALPVRWIKSTSQACGVHNGYAQAAMLGSDRWAALIAAWYIKHAPCVVVNAGTAVTIDALSVQPENNESQAEFIGGLILPGLNLMQQSLGLATAQLPKVDEVSNLTPQTPVAIFAKNTTDAIHAGALQAIVGAVQLMADALNQQCKQPPYVIISGGNAGTIKDNLKGGMIKQALIVDNLVLLGLYLLEHSMQGDQQ